MKIEHLGKSFYCDKRMYEDLEIFVADVVDSNLDLVLIITGDEGVGKSLLSRQISIIISYILYTKYQIVINPNINDIHFNLDTYIKSVLNGEKYKINILDESRSLLNRKSSTTRESKRFTNFLSENRKFNNFQILLLPAMHDLDKYCFLWRSRYFVHVIKSRDSNNKIVRGNYIVYPKDKRLIYHYEQNFYTYPKFQPKKYGGFMGDFNGTEVFEDMNKYEAKQRTIMLDKYVDKPKSDPVIDVAKKLREQGLSYVQIGEAVGKTRQTVSAWLNESDVKC